MRFLPDIAAAGIVVERSNVIDLEEERAKRIVRASINELLDALATERLQNG